MSTNRVRILEVVMYFTPVFHPGGKIINYVNVYPQSSPEPTSSISCSILGNPRRKKIVT